MPALEMSTIPQEILSSKHQIVLAEFNEGVYLLIYGNQRLIKKGINNWTTENHPLLDLADCVEMWRKESQNPKIAAFWAKAKENYEKQYGRGGKFNNITCTDAYWVKIAKPVRLTEIDFEEFVEQTSHCVNIPLPDDDTDDFVPHQISNYYEGQ